MSNGYGDGYGYGDGDGDGDGYGYGEKLTTIGGHDAVALDWPDPVVRVGCEVHTLDVWRVSWSEVAARHDVGSDEAREALEIVERHFASGSKRSGDKDD